MAISAMSVEQTRANIITKLYQVYVIKGEYGILNQVANEFRPGAIAEDVTDKALKAGYRHVRNKSFRTDRGC